MYILPQLKIHKNGKRTHTEHVFKYSHVNSHYRSHETGVARRGEGELDA